MSEQITQEAIDFSTLLTVIFVDEETGREVVELGSIWHAYDKWKSNMAVIE